LCGFPKSRFSEAAFFMKFTGIKPKTSFCNREYPVFGGVVSFPRLVLPLWHEYNGLVVFLGIPLRIEAQSGAIEPTSRKGVGPGLWWSHKDASPT
jgi:hypothetical protein